MEKREIYIWGCGAQAETTLQSIDSSQFAVKGFIDTDKKKQGRLMWEKYAVISMEKAVEEKPYAIVLSMKAYAIPQKEMEDRYPHVSFIAFWNQGEESEVFNEYARKYFFEREKTKRYELRLRYAPYEFGKKDFIIKSAEELLERVLRERKSMCRFGDGEFEIMFGRERAWFQSGSEELRRRLREIIVSENSEILVCVADDFGDLSRFKESAADGIRAYVLDSNVREELLSIGVGKKEYYDAYVSRPYILYKERARAARIFEGFRKIFAGRNILVVEGKGGNLGYNNDFLKDAVSLRRIICPAKDAFSVYDEIYRAVMENAERHDLALISLGPAATVLAYDLSASGLQALDIGQVDNEYDWFIRGVENRVEIEGKATAEVPSGYHRVAEHRAEEIVADLS